jgi:DNA helicase-2/ATP-dependent DNA helicase PcrA
LSKKVVIASAGAGKTHRIISEAGDYANQGNKVLVVTYTENNQKELVSRFSSLNLDNNKFVVKGLFSFLLEDIVRPYQRCAFDELIETINFNSNGDPHKRNGRTIPGRKELLACGSFNPDYYLTKCRKKAHTTYLSKLASKIMKLKEKEILDRLDGIYKHIYFDEVQDLVGWDYEILKALSKSKSFLITCVGDFRQTIYDTSVASKGPKSSEQKLGKFRGMKFDEEHLAVSRRSVQSICDYADKIHSDEGYKKTVSTIAEIPENFSAHVGVFCVSESNAIAYINEHKPVLLRHGISSGKTFNEVNIKKINFGKSKGLGFDRTIIVPTKPYIKYILGGCAVFDGDKSEESKNKLYVAITRARYSVAFILPDKQVSKCNLPEWKKG